MDRPSFLRAYGPWAVVAGAGAGLGASYSRQLAERGMSLVLVDRDADTLDAISRDLSDHGAVVNPMLLDLARDDAVEELMLEVTDRDIGLLVANAAAAWVGPFCAQEPESFEAQVRLNVLTPTRLIHRFLPGLAARERSGIIVMSSLSSRRGAPLVATYAATKAYLAVLAESLWYELSDDGVDVLAVLPGSTRTPGWLASDPRPGAGTDGAMDPDDVVAEVLGTLGSGSPHLVPGQANRDAEALLETLDRADAVRLVGDVMRQTYPNDGDSGAGT